VPEGVPAHSSNANLFTLGLRICRILWGLAHQHVQASASSTRLEIVDARAGLCGFADCALCVCRTLAAMSQGEQRNGDSAE
jgi:hypothetical protein